jgi:hypothetical protein
MPVITIRWSSGSSSGRGKEIMRYLIGGNRQNLMGKTGRVRTRFQLEINGIIADLQPPMPRHSNGVFCRIAEAGFFLFE